MRYLFLREQAREYLLKNRDEKVYTEDELREMDSLLLAYMGDALYSLFVREKVMACGIHKVQILHEFVTNIICAKAQAEVYMVLEEELTDGEKYIAKRARNKAANVPKSATVQEYRLSTAFEAVLGYLRLSGQEERLEILCSKAYRHSLEKSKG